MSEDSAFQRFLHEKLRIPQGMEHLVLTFGLVGLALLGLGAYWVGERFRVARGGLSDDAYIIRSWDPQAPVGLDVNGDGVEDIVGMYVGVGPVGHYVGAINGKDGKVMWRQGPFEVYTSRMGGLFTFGATKDFAVVVTKGSEAKLLALPGGERRGSVGLATARTVCRGLKEGTFRITTQQTGQDYALNPVSRGSQALPNERRICSRSTAHSLREDGASLEAPGKANWVLRDGALRVALTKDPAQGPVLHGYLQGNTTPAWSQPVAKAGNAKAGVHRDAQTADIADGRVIVAYMPQVGKPSPGEVVALQAKTGKEQWRTKLELPSYDLKSLTATSQRVYVVIGEYLVVFDAKTGKELLSLGEGKEE